MTLAELRKRCIEQGFQYAYGVFEEPVEPPHLVAIVQDSNNYGADNKVYLKKDTCMLDYTFIRKNQEEQNKIENEILKDVYWEKTPESYIEQEDIWQTSYFFELDNKEEEIKNV